VSYRSYLDVHLITWVIGYWVKHSHRIHVAIDSSDDVDFLVGAKAGAMEKVIFAEGSIIELNNQAKHAVHNRMKERSRVHFIFDYIEEEYLEKHLIPRYKLLPGDVVHQTRRSIDLDSHNGSRPYPR
jgi:hypothetical protein